ncbi:hypothetical protein GGR50DRAFT_580441 [Xylaria sp. CBS 124048]|nr:hypothetical protein GGR50DRAFT_580441 [Xylaria sp. CBS 124048]
MYGNGTVAASACPQAVYTTVYETVLAAACETSSWMATYTITETCQGEPSDYVTPTMPPGFVVTTVSCAVCAETEIEITCPCAEPTKGVHIEGNGVTATITATPHSAPNTGSYLPGPTAVPSSGHPRNSNSNNTYPHVPVPYTGDAMRLRKSLMAGAGLAFILGPLLLL